MSLGYMEGVHFVSVTDFASTVEGARSKREVHALC